MTDINAISFEMAQAMMKLFKHFKPKHFIGNLKPTEMMVLMTVFFNYKEKCRTVNPSDISDELGLSKSALTALLNSLEEKKLIERKLSAQDKRRIAITFTKDAELLVDEHHKSVEKTVYSLAEHLGKEDSQKFIALLAKSHKFLSE